MNSILLCHHQYTGGRAKPAKRGKNLFQIKSIGNLQVNGMLKESLSLFFFAFQVVKEFFGFQMHTKIRKQIYVNAA